MATETTMAIQIIQQTIIPFLILAFSCSVSIGSSSFALRLAKKQLHISNSKYQGFSFEMILHPSYDYLGSVS
jgi:hypothetical protein